MTITDWLKKCEEVEGKATKGPWIDTSNEEEVLPIRSCDDYSEICRDPELDDRESDRGFIAFSRTALPLAVKIIRRLVDAVKCYADEENWGPIDNGEIAKEALADLEEMVDEK